jgi:uncharacterized protein YkwD
MFNKHTRRRCAVAAIVVATLATVCVATAAADAAATPAMLTAKLGSGGRLVRVSWRLTTTSLPRDRTLTIERSVNAGTWTTVVTRLRPSQTGSWNDATPVTAPTSYRARFSVTGQPTVTSNVAIVNPPAGTTTTTTTPLPPNLAPCPAGYEDQVIAIINNHRGYAVARNTPLMNVAHQRAITNAQNGDLHHLADDELARMVEDAGYTNWQALGENLAFGYDTPQAVFDAWMGDAGHKNNMLATFWQDIGIGCVARSDLGNRLYWSLDVAEHF